MRPPKEIKPSRKDFVTNYPHFRYWKKRGVEEFLSGDPLNLYIHVPFCAQKCSYCYYKTERLEKAGQLEQYVDDLCREIPVTVSRFNLGRRPVQSIYIGGGTPSLLKEDLLGRIVDCLRRHLTIGGDDGTGAPEFTLEAEPRTITAKKIAAYKTLGVNRMSIGIQSFNDDIIKLSGRGHSGDRALRAINTVLDTGGITLNIDLLSGLAGETDDTWARTVDTAINTGAHNITVYKMEVYLNTEFFSKSVRRQEIKLPDEAQELEFMRAAIDKFTAANYKPWSFFTYTRDGGHHHRYASNLWKGQDCCAFGPSAFGQIGPYNYQNAALSESYRSLLDTGQPPMIRAHKLNSKDLMIKDLLLGMKLDHFDRQLFENRHGFDFCALIPDTVSTLEKENYITLDPETISLTPKGLLYGDYVGKKLADALKKHLGMDKLSLY